MARQNLLFAYFTCTLAAEIRAAKAEGRYFEGVSDLGGSHMSKVEPEVCGALSLPPTPLPQQDHHVLSLRDSRLMQLPQGDISLEQLPGLE